MAGITLNQLATAIAGEQGEKVGDTSYITQCETWLKEAMVEIDSEANSRAFSTTLPPIVTVAGQSRYDLPENYRSIKYLRFVDTDDPIEYCNPRTLANYGVDFEQQGRPRWHWISDPIVNGSNQFIQRLSLQPVPNGVFTIDGMYFFDVINIGSSTILPLTQQAIIALKSRLRMEMHKNDKDWDSYNAERGQYSRNLALFLKSEANKPSRAMKKRYSDMPRRGRPSRLRYPHE